jgi:hypothetical protein
MGKTNYTKVENILEHGLRKLLAYNLLKEVEEKGGKIAEATGEEVVRSITHELKALKKLDPKVYRNVGIEPKQVEVLIENQENLSENELDLAKKLLQKIRQYKREFLEKNPPPSDEELIELQKKRHVTKRHNVNEKWLPLD